LEKIRLIIWDLDETFWNGIIAEGDVEIPKGHVDILKELVNRGIMNSICSKNDFEVVKEYLVKQGLWDLFIFPSISYDSKGGSIKKVVDQVKLRPESIMFIDDNLTNLQEVKYVIPKINISTPDIIGSILSHECFQGKDDKKHSRLAQYKILEKKSKDMEISYSNEEFLRKSNIQVEILNDCTNELTRIYELIERTNQLNFTKKRISVTELEQLLEDENIENGYIKVKDAYGDYGIIGFYSIRNNILEHYMFSCRTLGLGVEQWVYSVLNFPDVELEGETVAKLNAFEKPNWINMGEKSNNLSSSIKGDKHCLLLGGCDLEQVAFYLDSSNINMHTEFNYNYKNYDVHREHSELIRQNLEFTNELKKSLIDTVPWYDERVFSSTVFSDKYDVIVYSPIIDFSSGIYSKKSDPKIKIVYDNYCFDLKGKSTSPKWEHIIDEYQFDGIISEGEFYSNLQLIRENTHNIPLILLNASNQDVQHPEEPNRAEVHQKYNKVIKDFCENNQNTYLLDVNDFITSVNDHTDNIRHYKRHIYYSIAEQIVGFINSFFNENMMEMDESKKHKTNISSRIFAKTILRKTGLLPVAYSMYRKMNKNNIEV
jgi:FkbH-like protein